MDETGYIRGQDASGKSNIYLISFSFVLASVIAPLWIVDYPGMVDYPNHLVRCYILAHYDEKPIWQERYKIDHTPIPNLAIELITVPLARWIPIVTCGKIFLTIAATLFVTGCSALGRAVTGKPNWLALIAAFMFYNSGLLYGFVNYVFGIGVFLCVLTFWLESRYRMSASRFLPLCALSVIAYFSHLSSVVFLVVACTTISLVDFYRDRRISGLVISLAWLACPAVLMVGFMKGNGTVGRIEWSTVSEKLVYLLSPIRSYNNLLDVIVLVTLLISAFVTGRKGRIHSTAAASAVMIVLFLVTPKVLFTSSAADARYVVPAFVLLLVSIEPRWGRPQKTAVAIALLAMGIRTAGIAANWISIDQRSRQMLQIGSVLPADARVYVIQPVSEEISKQDRGFVHVIEFWTISHEAYLSSLFGFAGQQPLVFRQPLCQGPDPVKCLAGYDYVWTDDPPASTKQDLLKVATPASAWENVTLWRLRR